MSQQDIALMAHLMRRAGFGATREDLERYVARGYETMVEELLHPENATPALDDEDIQRRYHIGNNSFMEKTHGQTYWLYRMVNTTRPMEEKIALFWHGIMCTAYDKLNHPRVTLRQIDMFRRFGLGSFHTLLVEQSKDPSMILYLDNENNHMDGVNENYGRELLELFSMGVGNYTEDDVRQASRSFTGWTIRNATLMSARMARNSVWPYGRLDWQYEYRDDDHDEGEKVFLGQEGAFNGEDIIDIICRQPATARFVSRHLYNFFVADEPQVPAWETVPPRDPEAINTLMEAYFNYDYDVRSMLRVLFNSDFFKTAAFSKVKSPTEVVVGTVRLTGGHSSPTFDDTYMALEAESMGQELLNPPSVEGWHTGAEWITTGSLVDRVNFAVKRFSDVSKPGVKSIIGRIHSQGEELPPEGLVDSCLDFIGPLTVCESTRQELVSHARGAGVLRFGSTDEDRVSGERIKEMLQLICGTREYQLG